MPQWRWNDRPVIFGDDGESAESKVRWRRMQREQTEVEKYGFVLDHEGMKKICPWCGLVCKSLEDLAAHEEECE